MSTLIGFDCNMASYISASYNDPDFVKAIAAIKPDVLRTPGSTANDYHPKSKSARPPFDSLKNIQPLGARMVFTLNMVTKGLRSSLEMLHHAVTDLGFSDDFDFECGNELNNVSGGTPLEQQIAEMYPNGEVYADTCAEWNAAIKKDFPNSRCLVMGGDRGKAWRNEFVTSRIPDAQLVMHTHIVNQYVFNGITDTDIIRASIDQDFQRRFAGIDPKKVCITEWNLQQEADGTKDVPNFANSTQAIIAARTVLQKFTEMGFDMACYHNLVGSGGGFGSDYFGAIVSNKWQGGTYLSIVGSAIRDYIASR